MSDGMSEAFGVSYRKEREAELKKYIVFYVQDSDPKVKKFETLAEAKKFAKRINKSNSREHTWVDFIVKGKILWSES